MRLEGKDEVAKPKGEDESAPFVLKKLRVRTKVSCGTEKRLGRSKRYVGVQTNDYFNLHSYRNLLNVMTTLVAVIILVLLAKADKAPSVAGDLLGGLAIIFVFTQLSLSSLFPYQSFERYDTFGSLHELWLRVDQNGGLTPQDLDEFAGVIRGLTGIHVIRFDIGLMLIEWLLHRNHTDTQVLNLIEEFHKKIYPAIVVPG